jgi:hypothetical protein
MKRLILFLTLSFILIEVKAQSEFNTKKNEVGLILFSVKSNYGQLYSKSPYTSFLNGLTYRRILDKGAIRIGVDFRDRNDMGTGDFIGSSKYKEGRLMTGFQLYLIPGTVKPYIATDLTFLHSKFQSEFSGGFLQSYHREDLIYNGRGLSPAAGLNIRLTRTLSLSLEASLEFLWITKKGTRAENSSGDINTIFEKSIKEEDFVFRFNPLNIVSINYSF